MNDKRTKRSIWLTFDRILSHDLGKQVLILLGILAFIFVISTICLHFAGPDWQAYCQSKRISKWVFPFYLLIDGNAFSNFYMDSASSRLTVILTCIFYFAGIIVFTGMTISVMTNMISRRVEKHQDGLIHVSQMANRRVNDPAEVVHLHQHLKVKVLEVDMRRRRISLTLKGVKD